MAVYGFRNNKMVVHGLTVADTPTFTEGDFTGTTGPIASTADSVARLKVWANGTAYYVPLHQ